MHTPKEIQELARKLRTCYSNDKFKTDLEATIKKTESEYNCKITREEVSTDDIDKLLQFSGKSGTIERVEKSKFLITINPYDSELRKRFTTAHELGHIALNHLEVGLKILEPTVNIKLDREEIWDPVDQREKDANKFAAELLMPEDLVRSFFSKEDDIDINFIEKGAEKFKVSKSAMMTRLNFLGFSF